MASDVEIANLALSHLGDSATVADLDPPEGSAQAEHCARFYPLARDALLEMRNWTFAMRRTTGAALTSETTTWQYAYAFPTDAISIIAVLPPDASGDYNALAWPPCEFEPINTYTPQPYVVETLSTGARVIYTNQEDALIRYKARVTDTTKFSPLFTLALSHYLASMLAGPVIKGDAGAAEGKRQLQLMQGYLGFASNSDGNQREGTVQHVVPWIGGR